MGKKIELLNDICPEIDDDMNKYYYDEETTDTAIVYQIFNVNNEKSYIGRAHSYVKNGNQEIRRHGAKDRFYRHWLAAKNNDNDCPIFYEALRESDILDWFVFTLRICSKKHVKEWETKLTKEHNTSDPEYGYNYFVGDNKPNNKEHLAKYQSAKALSNAQRAVNGQLRKMPHSKDLPANINYRVSKRNGAVCGEGYFVQIKINGKLYNKAFLSMHESMESKLNRAVAQLELFKKQASTNNNNNNNNKSGSKSSVKRSANA